MQFSHLTMVLSLYFFYIEVQHYRQSTWALAMLQ